MHWFRICLRVFSDREFVMYMRCERAELATGGENREIAAGAAGVRDDDLMDQSFEGVWKR